MFLSSCGALSAGRQNPDSALFPYYSSDKILDTAHCTGPKTVLRINDDATTQTNQLTPPSVWEPFSFGSQLSEGCRRNLYKNLMGNRFLFEEINEPLGLTFRYGWTFGKRFGFIRSCELINLIDRSRSIDVVDGFQNLVPSGLGQAFQLQYSNLADAYKKSELLTGSEIAIHYLSSIPTDRAEPSEGLQATIAWQLGLKAPQVSVSAEQLNGIRAGQSLRPEPESRGRRHAYLVSSSLQIEGGGSAEWTIVADTNYDHCRIAELHQAIQRDQDSGRDDLRQDLARDIENTESSLVKIISTADGRQSGADLRRIDRHQSNVLFNVMRGGLPVNGYEVPTSDFRKRVRASNRDLEGCASGFLGSLPDSIGLSDLLDRVAGEKNTDLIRIASEYLPFHFSRRHGDPTRPWNQFSIDLNDESGSPKLAYQGNWRDIFQNWEALSVSFPHYAASMVLRFVNATTADGYNPYRVTESGFEWEVPEPNDPWSNIGYWGDHQIAYLLRLLERAIDSTPERLTSYWTSEQCVYANIPYKIRSYEQICDDPFETIDFDLDLASQVDQRVERIGSDGRLLQDQDEQIVYVSLIEKLLVPALAKLSNFVPGGGIWLNTQRPEWNDANNALVGRGLSVVTACYLRRYLTFLMDCFDGLQRDQLIDVRLSDLVAQLLVDLGDAFESYTLNEQACSDDQQRKRMLDTFASAGSRYRQALYQSGLSNNKRAVPISALIRVLSNARDMIDRTIQSNQRPDGLYHSYNLLELSEQTASVTHLYEMLEGQVAVLNSGLLSANQSADLLDGLRQSRLYRDDQQSYLLYPDRKLSRFMEKNCIDADSVERSELLTALLKADHSSLIQRDVSGTCHFHGSFRNVNDVNAALDQLAHIDTYRDLVQRERGRIADIWEATFGHRLFTGRSGTFFGYEGLGSIYWHMVSKLALAVVEQCLPLTERLCLKDSDTNNERIELDRLLSHYREIRSGLGIHKSPEQYGAFPQDPYSHTPEGRGVQQPGMTGQVKEDVLARWHELGIRLRRGQLRFDLKLFETHELLTEPTTLDYFDLHGNRVGMDVPAGGFAFTFCQTPVLYRTAQSGYLRLHQDDGKVTERAEWELTKSESNSILSRTAEIAMIEIGCPTLRSPDPSE